LSPVPIQEVVQEIKKVKEQQPDKLQAVIDYFETNTEVQISARDLEMVAALKVALQNLCESYGCNAGVIQCWT
ncbi:hypothetical protein B1K96_38920, partial [Escherichia coli]